MAITLKGIRLESLSFSRDEKDGGYTVPQAEYSLITSTDKVVAKQTISGYYGLKLALSAATVKALEDFVALYMKDVRAVTGLEE